MWQIEPDTQISIFQVGLNGRVPQYQQVHNIMAREAVISILTLWPLPPVTISMDHVAIISMVQFLAKFQIITWGHNIIGIDIVTPWPSNMCTISMAHVVIISMVQFWLSFWLGHGATISMALVLWPPGPATISMVHGVLISMVRGGHNINGNQYSPVPTYIMHMCISFWACNREGLGSISAG